MKCMIIFLLLATISHSAFANRFYFSMAGRGGLGKGGTVDSESTETRDLYVFGADATLGFLFGGVMFGGNAEYNVWKQKTDPDDVSETNISGTQISFAPAVAVPIGRWMFQVKSPLSSTFSMSLKSEDGEVVKYSKPTLPYTLMAAYSMGRYYIGIEYSKIEYKTLNQGGDDTTLDSDKRLALSSFGVVYGFKF